MGLGAVSGTIGQNRFPLHKPRITFVDRRRDKVFAGTKMDRIGKIHTWQWMRLVCIRCTEKLWAVSCRPLTNSAEVDCCCLRWHPVKWSQCGTGSALAAARRHGSNLLHGNPLSTTPEASALVFAEPLPQSHSETRRTVGHCLVSVWSVFILLIMYPNCRLVALKKTVAPAQASLGKCCRPLLRGPESSVMVHINWPQLLGLKSVVFITCLLSFLPLLSWFWGTGLPCLFLVG